MRRNTSKLEEQGRKIMDKYPRRGLGSYDVYTIHEQSRGSYEMGMAMYNIGVAIGHKIAMEEQKARGKA